MEIKLLKNNNILEELKDKNSNIYKDMCVAIENYLSIMDNKDKLVDDKKYQSKYKNFYKMNRVKNPNKNFYQEYFKIINKLKGKDNIDFKTVYNEVRKFQTNNEISFASKLAHTLNDDLPIWDEIVASIHFGYLRPSKESSNWENASIYLYEAYQRNFAYYKNNNPEAKQIIKTFNKVFKDYEDKISDTKKIDFILWLDRDN